MGKILLFLVRTVHNGMYVLKCLRRIPIVNQNNKIHVGKFWWKQGKDHVYIMQIVDDYTHWMWGVYLSDKNISYYNPDIWCHITWIPILIQFLSIIILNSYIWYGSHYPRTKHCKPVITHKYVLMDIFRNLLNKAKHYYANRKLKISQWDEET